MTAQFHSHSLRRDVGRFLVSGGLATGLHWVSMFALVELGTPPDRATVAGAICGAIANYLLLFHFAFAQRASHRSAGPAYLLVLIVGWIANLLVFRGLHGGLAWPVAMAQVATSALVAGLNFLLYRGIVFHGNEAVLRAR